MASTMLVKRQLKEQLKGEVKNRKQQRNVTSRRQSITDLLSGNQTTEMRLVAKESRASTVLYQENVSITWVSQ